MDGMHEDNAATDDVLDVAEDVNCVSGEGDEGRDVVQYVRGWEGGPLRITRLEIQRG